MSLREGMFVTAKYTAEEFSIVSSHLYQLGYVMENGDKPLTRVLCEDGKHRFVPLSMFVRARSF